MSSLKKCMSYIYNGVFSMKLKRIWWKFKNTYKKGQLFLHLKKKADTFPDVDLNKKTRIIIFGSDVTSLSIIQFKQMK